MAKCLVTKLSGTVNNKDLLRVGEFSINFSVNKDNATIICSASNITIDDKTVDSLNNISKGNHVLKVHDKYKAFFLGMKSDGATFDLSSMKGSYMCNITELINTNDTTYEHYNTFKGDVSDISKLSNLTSVVFSSCKDITGKMEDFSSLTNLQILDCHNLKKLTLHDPSVFSNLKKIKELNVCYTECNIEGFANCLSLEQLNIKYCPAEGKIDKLAQLMHANGRKSGSLIINCGFTNITCDAVSKEQQSESYSFTINFSDSNYTIK